MPSPFPGMDPYLEGALWTTFHFAFGAVIVRQLAPRLRPRYLVLPVERFVIYLQQAFTATYELLGHDLALDYTRPPDPLLDADSESAADRLLRAAGLRSV